MSLARGSARSRHHARQADRDRRPAARETPTLVDITPQTHDVEVDSAYASARNLTGKPVYARAADCDIAPPAQRNRFTLLGLMSTARWDLYGKEWWHYQLFAARNNDPLLSDSVLTPPMM